MPGENKDEVIVIAPYFPEYKVFINMTGAGCVIVPPKMPDFPDRSHRAQSGNNSLRTKAVIVNSEQSLRSCIQKGNNAGAVPLA